MALTLMVARSRERMLVWAALILMTTLAWGILMLHSMPAKMAMPQGEPVSGTFGPGLLVMAILMWGVMMVAMMLPSAGPMILMYLRIRQRRVGMVGSVPSTWVFIAGYLVVWSAFAVAAGTGQVILHQSDLLSSAMGRVGPVLAGALLIMAGVFQFSSLKAMCLSKCRSPLGFIMTEWREGASGALIMGARHGVYCTGCCWALMLLMFVGGAMSLLWMAGLAAYFLVEKLLPWADQIRQASGVLFIGAGLLALGSAM